MRSNRQKKVLTVLVVFVLLFVCCKKKQPHPTDHTHKMAGVRHWHGTKEYHTAGDDSVINYIDDSFSIIVVNNKEIIHTITNTHLYFDAASDSVLSFLSMEYAGNGQYYTEGIIYYFLSDRIQYYDHNPYPKSGYTITIDLETP